MHQKRLDRINELARKQKSERLTEAEKAEQKKLREEYLAEDGNPDVEKMGIITYDPVHHGYMALGNSVGHAFADGNQLK